MSNATSDNEPNWECVEYSENATADEISHVPHQLSSADNSINGGTIVFIVISCIFIIIFLGIVRHSITTNV
jgi:hypothetical protein